MVVRWLVSICLSPWVVVVDRVRVGDANDDGIDDVV